MKHSILYVDDNKSLTAAVSEYLGRAGYEVDCAHTIAEAKARFSQKTYSMVLVDLKLSTTATLEGLEFACAIRDQSPWTPLALFSACISPEVEVETIRRKMKIICKPTPLPALRAMISTYLRERYPLYPTHV